MNFPEFNLMLCNNLRLLRMMKNMSQLDVASSLGISRSSYSAIESGKQAISLYHAIKLSEVLRVDASILWSKDLQKAFFTNLHCSEISKPGKS